MLANPFDLVKVQMQAEGRRKMQGLESLLVGRPKTSMRCAPMWQELQESTIMQKRRGKYLSKLVTLDKKIHYMTK